VDGNKYNIVVIGAQIWMAENLKTTKFNNNGAIPNVTSGSTWTTLTTPAYCWYANDGTTNKPIYGAIYNWFTVNTGNLCPAGWHMPSDGEYQTLESYLGIPADTVGLYGWRGRISQAGSQMKNTTGWATGQNGTNISGFSALPGGYRYVADGSFNDIGVLTYFWTATEYTSPTAWYRRLDGALDVTNNEVYRAAVEKGAGKYVRCLKN
jgi:uncharacterized protein (TIGR02145 family)